MIYGNGLRLRAIEKEDLVKFTEWLNDPEVRSGLLIYSPLSMVQEERWFSGVLERPSEEQPLVIEVHKDDGWTIIGNIGLHNFDWRCRTAEVGIFIGDKSYWNQGFGTKAMRLMLQYGFDTLNLNRIGLDVYENNPRAIRSYEKAGFVHEGRKRQAMYRDGKYLDVHVMSVLRAEWKAD
jgi:RimJ/RimL family protein N-acetyltransferase